MIIGDKIFDTQNKTYIMGILNVTPDSFSDGGSWNNIDDALNHTEQLIKDGADIIDIGGESTRPGYTRISEDEEISRITPIIEAVKKNFDITVSVDTYKSKVALSAIKSGTDMINDIWGLKYSNNIAECIAEFGVSCCIMHNRREAKYENFLEDVKTDLKESLLIAEKAGIAKNRIMIDPGIGFAKTYQQNLNITKHIYCLKDLGYPILYGASRKSLIGLTLNLPKNEREEGTLALSVYAALNKCSFVRVHDVKKNRRALDMIEAVLNTQEVNDGLYHN